MKVEVFQLNNQKTLIFWEAEISSPEISSYRLDLTAGDKEHGRNFFSQNHNTCTIIDNY